ncbi:MAG: SIMPL domain-containing protein [Chloroflexi bacterium]|nr:SIMPL domain-containing protein [Chloroflexota bacterium]
MMQKKYLLFATITALLLMAILLCGCQQAGSSLGGVSASQQEGIWVTGQGKVTVAPDVVNVQLGIEAQSQSVADAQSQAVKAMDDVMAALTSNGVARKDIQTQYYSIQQLTKWDNDKQQEVPAGYQVTNIVTAKIRDPDNAGTVIDAVTTAGGDLTRIDSLQFTIDDPTVYYDQAREKAMADAKDTATQLANLSGVKLGKPIYISESGASVPQPQVILAKSTTDAGTSTPISPGELEISLTVQVTYAIR